jgi:hypothetical protein
VDLARHAATAGDHRPAADRAAGPASWHLVYLLGAAVVLDALAVWRSQARARGRRRAQAAAAVVLVAALAATAAAAVVQTRPTSPALTARRLAAASNPPAALVCQRRGPAVHCVFPGFEPQIGLWEPTVRAVVAAVPPAAAARAAPVTVAQRIGWARLIEENEDDPTVGDAVGDTVGDTVGDNRVAPVGTAWGWEGQARLASNVAARVIELSGTEIPPRDPEPGSDPGPGPSGGGIGCNARAVVALWLAARASPHAAEVLRQQVTWSRDQDFSVFWFTHDLDIDDPQWGLREGQFAMALLERPGDQVGQTLWRNWDLVTSPGTTLERLGELLGVQPPPGPVPTSDVSGPSC